MIINQVRQGDRSSIFAGDVLSGFSENLLPFLSGEQSPNELLTVIPGGTVEYAKWTRTNQSGL
jgi:hypothetical protein